MTAMPKPNFARVLTIIEAEQMTQQRGAMTLSTPFDDDDERTDYKWSQVQTRLGLASNVANARWMPEKIMPLFEGLEAPTLLTTKGRPTKFCVQMLSRYKRFCVDDKQDYEIFVDQVKKHFAKKDDDTLKPSRVEVLPKDDDGDIPITPTQPLAGKQQQIERRVDLIDDRLMRTLQAIREAKNALVKHDSLDDADWEQRIIEDELQKIEQEARLKKREMELRERVRQMTERMSGDGEPS